jgi:hypothetical protein
MANFVDVTETYCVFYEVRTQFLGTFTEFRRSPVSYVMSVRPSVHMTKLTS